MKTDPDQPRGGESVVKGKAMRRGNKTESARLAAKLPRKEVKLEGKERRGRGGGGRERGQTNYPKELTKAPKPESLRNASQYVVSPRTPFSPKGGGGLGGPVRKTPINSREISTQKQQVRASRKKGNG